MVRLRNAVMAFVLATGLTGCTLENFTVANLSIWHCDSCDDFPAPAYGPDYSMMPGTYTRPITPGSTESGQPAAPTSPAGAMPGMTSPVPITTPPLPPSAPPGADAGAR